MNREYGIDILRIVSTVGVVILHVFGIFYLKSSAYSGGGYNLIVNYNIASLFEIMFMCSVNVFGIITGYLYAGREKHSSYSLIKLLVAYIFYSVLVTFVIKAIYPESIKTKIQLINNLLPILGGRLWYITAYVFVFFMIPYMNLFVKLIDKRHYVRFLGIIAVLLGLLSMVKDFFGISMGYSCFWLIFCYFVGAYIKLYKIDIRKSVSLLLFTGSCLFIFMVNVSTQLLNINFIDKIYGRLITYTSPLIVLNSVSVFFIFKAINVSNKYIKETLKICSGSALAVYIIHAHGLFLDNILYPLMPAKLKENPLKFICFGLIFVFLVFVGGIIIDIIRIKFEKIIKIDNFYKKIATKVDTILLWNCEKK